MPVPLVAAALSEGAADRGLLLRRMQSLVSQLEAIDAVLRLHPDGLPATLEEGLTSLAGRALVQTVGAISPTAGAEALLAFYAAPVLQRLELG